MPQSDIEYEVITKTRADLQKVLNIWRHNYDLVVEGICADGDGIYTAIVKRSLKRTTSSVRVITPEHIQREGRSFREQADNTFVIPRNIIENDKPIREENGRDIEFNGYDQAEQPPWGID